MFNFVKIRKIKWMNIIIVFGLCGGYVVIWISWEKYKKNYYL